MAEVRTYETKNNSAIWIILFIAVILAALALVDLPLTIHAETKHVDEKVNAASLITMITAGACRDMEVFDCPNNATTVILCKIKNNIVGGLVLGTSLDGTQHIITGFAARPKYWKNNVSGCRYMGGTFALQ